MGKGEEGLTVDHGGLRGANGWWQRRKGALMNEGKQLLLVLVEVIFPQNSHIFCWPEKNPVSVNFHCAKHWKT